MELTPSSSLKFKSSKMLSTVNWFSPTTKEKRETLCLATAFPSKTYISCDLVPKKTADYHIRSLIQSKRTSTNSGEFLLRTGQQSVSTIISQKCSNRKESSTKHPLLRRDKDPRSIESGQTLSTIHKDIRPQPSQALILTEMITSLILTF